MTRIITRPDFDGVVCAVLLKEVLGETTPVVWSQPNVMQRGAVPLRAKDVVANLPLAGDVALWFDHHVSNATDRSFKGLYRIAPSAARLIYEYFHDTLKSRFEELVRQADKIDDAQLSIDEILYPERYPYVLLSMSISTRKKSDEAYCDHLVHLLRTRSIEQLLVDPTVRQRCDETVTVNKAYENELLQYTTLHGHVSITDFRALSPVPDGNRFLVYSLFPEANVNVKLYHEGAYTVIKLGHSILNRTCQVNVGKLLSRYGGGGHRGAGACRFEREHADAPIAEILATLTRNQA
ncbi:MAG: exopolyphosphatase [Desulfatitalea sp. BRH_c12]|nr:MAG: exopolyphosphatase [Desulfatitalea sp. BRH_c12]